MNQIPTRQNEATQLERLGAQRELYSIVKQWQVWQLIISVVASVCLSVWALIDPDKSDWAGIWGGIVAILDVLLFDHLMSGMREKAAKVQEKFDCYVLDLACSPLYSPDDLTDHEIATYANKHRRTPGNMEKLANWYPLAVDKLPIHLARLVCQLSNCSWDSELKRRYANLAGKLLFVTVAVLVLLGLIFKEGFKEFLLMTFSFAPFLTYCFKQYKDQNDASKRQKDLVLHTKTLWSTAFSENSQTIMEQSRQLQNAIYDARSKNPAILDVFYDRLKNEQETTMNRTAEDLVADALNRLESSVNRPL